MTQQNQQPDPFGAVDLGLQIDYGRNQPDDVLQRWDGERWQDYRQNGKLVTSPFDFDTLPPGRYWLRHK